MKQEPYPKGKQIPGTRLTPLRMTHSRNNSIAYECVCSCGKKKTIADCNIRHGRTKSCGCYSRDSASKRMTVHGLSKTPEYFASFSAFDRCYNKNCPQYGNYGKRGIRCDFKSVSEMAKWLVEHLPKPKGGRLLLDRVENNGNYEKGNLRWATPMQSSNNTRWVRIATLNGITKTISQWSRESGLCRQTIMDRIKRQLPDEMILVKGKITEFKAQESKFNGNKKGTAVSARNGEK